MDLKLIPELTESMQYRSKSMFQYTTARQVCDHAFMDMIAIWILYNEFETAPKARDYAGRTMTYNGFKTFRQASTDLYLTMHVITQDRTDLLSSDEDSTLLGRITLDEQKVIRYLRETAGNKITQMMVRQTLQKLERALYIENSNYRSVRRLAQNWPTLSTSQKRTTLTRMLMFYRVNARRSEMFKELNQLARSKNLIDPNAKDPGLAAKAAAVGVAAVGGFAAGRALGKRF